MRLETGDYTRQPARQTEDQIAGHGWGGIHLYFQHMGGKNTSHDCYKFKARLVYIVNSRPELYRKIRTSEKGREGTMKGEGRGGDRREGRVEKWGRTKKSQEWDTHLTAPTLKLKQEILGSRSA